MENNNKKGQSLLMIKKFDEINKYIDGIQLSRTLLIFSRLYEEIEFSGWYFSEKIIENKFPLHHNGNFLRYFDGTVERASE